jgi:hypothetical protein
MLGSTLGVGWAAGLAVHFINGSVIFPVVYTYVLYAHLPGAALPRRARGRTIDMKRALVMALAMLGLVGVAFPARAQRGNGNPPFPSGITPLWEPEFVDASKAGFLRDEDIVIGVTGNGVTKAYPGAATAWHHIVHDRLGNVPILATW